MTGQDEEPHHLREPVSGADWTRGPSTGSGSPHDAREGPSRAGSRGGPADAPVTLVEYADFQCEFCQAAYPEIEKVLRARGDQVRFVFRHFPLQSSHPRALAAALAAEAAGRQGKFWEMHATLFEHPGRLEEEDLRRYARELGLDLERFDADRADPELAAKIQHQKRVGARSGVNGTPCFYINGLRYDGPRDSRSLSGVLEQAAQQEPA